ncbi:MAG: DUF928 domain-containing protein [Symploca sp. SIO3E6]|nr:DUF928 domain-containing protein [Caldora sp. SIO3E6]
MIKLLLHKTTLTSALVLVLVSLFSYPQPVQPIPIDSSIMVAQGNKQTNFRPRNRGRRGRRRSGAIRTANICQVDSSLRLTALVPKATTKDSREPWTDEEEPILSGTLESHPTFRFYIPNYEAQPLTAKLTIQDENQGEEIHKVEVELTNTPGIISIKIKGEKGLEAGKIYYWQFQVICDRNDSNKNPRVEGWIERDSLAALTHEEQQTLEDGTPQEKLDIYFEHKIWHEALELLIEERHQNPDNLSTYWKGMMYQEEDDILREVAEEMIVDCCSVSIAEEENPAGS